MNIRHERLVQLLETLADCAVKWDGGYPLTRDEAVILRTHGHGRGLTVGDLREARRLLEEMRRA